MIPSPVISTAPGQATCVYIEATAIDEQTRPPRRIFLYQSKWWHRDTLLISSVLCGKWVSSKWQCPPHLHAPPSRLAPQGVVRSHSGRAWVSIGGYQSMPCSSSLTKSNENSNSTPEIPPGRIWKPSWNLSGEYLHSPCHPFSIHRAVSSGKGRPHRTPRHRQGEQARQAGHTPPLHCADPWGSVNINSSTLPHFFHFFLPWLLHDS